MRYTRPLQPGQARKWQRLTEDLGVEIYVTSFAHGLRPQCFREHARFIQWPALPLAPLRWLTAWLLVPPVVLWLVFTRRVDVMIAHDPVIGAAAALTRGLAGDSPVDMLRWSWKHAVISKRALLDKDGCPCQTFGTG